MGCKKELEITEKTAKEMSCNLNKWRETEREGVGGIRDRENMWQIQSEINREKKRDRKKE